MLGWWKQFRESSNETKAFILVCFLFGACLILTTAFSYGRLDFVRSGKKQPDSVSTKSY